MKIKVAIVALGSGLTAVCGAASPPPVPANLIACSRMQDAGARVRCYDAQVAAMNRAAAGHSAPAAASPAAVTAPPPSARASTSGTPEQRSAAQFGAELLPPTSHPARADNEAVLHSSITAMRRVGPEVYEISLANGQVWRQDGSRTTAFFRVGDEVRIEKHVLGSYHMSTSATGSKNWVRVTRLR